MKITKTLFTLLLMSSIVIESMAITIYVKTLTGTTFSVKVELTDTVLKTKEQLAKQNGVLAQNQSFKYYNNTLDDNKTLNDYHIQDNDVIHVVYRMPKR